MDKINYIKSNLPIAKLLDVLNIKVNKSGFVKSIYKNEKTPSLKIYFDTNSYYCFATSQGGDVIKFYKDYYGITDKQAIEDLYKIAGGETIIIDKTPAEKKENDNTKNNFYDCLTPDEKYLFDETAGLSNEENARKEVIKYRLNTNKKIFNYLYEYCRKYIAHSFYTYLVEDRQITTDTIIKYKLFYIENYFQVNQHLKKTFKLYELIAAGLYNENGNLIFAKHRLIIPYLYNDEIVYLRGRYFDSGDTDSKGFAKYIGLKNDLVNANTTKRLYNVDVFKQMYNGDRLFIVEGEFDALVLAQEGLFAVAIPGVGNIPDKKWFEKMVNYRVIILTDNDEAGEKLRSELNQILKSLNANVDNYYLNKHKDISEFVKTL